RKWLTHGWEQDLQFDQKQMSMKQISLKILFLLPILSLACSTSTKVTSSWVAGDPDRMLSSFNEVMVIALLPDKDRNLQQTMESNMVTELVAKGVKARSAYEAYGPKYFTKNEKQALRQLKEKGADGVITIVLLDKTKEKNYVPGTAAFPP